LMVSLHRWIYA